MDEQDELRRHVGQVLQDRADTILKDAFALHPFTRKDRTLREPAARCGELTLQLLVTALRDRDIDARNAQLVDLGRVMRDTPLSIKEIVGLVHVVERAALDELALHETFGATAEPWPAVAQIVRRASFDVLAGYAERLAQEGGEHVLNDTLTTLHTRQVLMAALEKEIHRSERFAHPFALIVFDIDRLSAINDANGFGFGDRILERIGIVLRNYFREQDWVCRSSGDRFAVLLPETHHEHAELLAERVRVLVQERMALRGYQGDADVAITVSVGVLIAQSVDATVKADYLLREAEQAVLRAKHGGRNRVERIDINVAKTAPPPRDIEEL